MLEFKYSNAIVNSGQIDVISDCAGFAFLRMLFASERIHRGFSAYIGA
jgi:hypothetical protein